MSIIGKTIGALGNLTLVLVIIIFIFAVMGMQVNLFSDSLDILLNEIMRIVIWSTICENLWSRHASMEFLRFLSCFYVSQLD